MKKHCFVFTNLFTASCTRAESAKTWVAQPTNHAGWLGGPSYLWCSQMTMKQQYFYVLFTFQQYQKSPDWYFNCLITSQFNMQLRSNTAKSPLIFKSNLQLCVVRYVYGAHLATHRLSLYSRDHRNNGSWCESAIHKNIFNCCSRWRIRNPANPKKHDVE